MKRKKTASKISFILLILMLLLAVSAYKLVLSNNIQDRIVLYIPKDATFTQVCDSLVSHPKNLVTFKIVSGIFDYKNHIQPGRYVLDAGMNNYQIVKKLKSGNQDPVKLRFISTRTKNLLAEKFASQLDFSKDEFSQLLENDEFTAKFGLNPNTIISLFIPNTYFIYWDIDPEDFIEKMHQEYQIFWNENRLKQASNLGLTPTEVIIVASIVQEETNKNDEKPSIASVYLNRLNRGMPLQADPTVKYAYGDFAVKRIVREHLASSSPYNTYKYKGLPPGPINTPDISSIDAVLKGQKTSYLYFCANADFSGYHAFASNFAEHSDNARKYHRALNARGIK